MQFCGFLNKIKMCRAGYFPRYLQKSGWHTQWCILRSYMFLDWKLLFGISKDQLLQAYTTPYHFNMTINDNIHFFPVTVNSFPNGCTLIALKFAILWLGSWFSVGKVYKDFFFCSLLCSWPKNIHLVPYIQWWMELLSVPVFICHP